MKSVEEKLFHLLEEIAEENQRLLEMLQDGWTLAEAENQLGGAEAGMTQHTPTRHAIHRATSKSIALASTPFPGVHAKCVRQLGQDADQKGQGPTAGDSAQSRGGLKTARSWCKAPSGAGVTCAPGWPKAEGPALRRLRSTAAWLL